jgi:hypothetical protein
MQEDVVLPKEGDIVTWKQNPQLIIKAKLGQRREHIPSTCAPCEADFYRPERELYVGQFPIDYMPEKFALISKEQAEKLPIAYNDHGLEFSLMLNGAKAEVTDHRSSNLELDDINQVKVQIKHLHDLDDTNFTKEGYEKHKKSPEFKHVAVTHEFGLECSLDNRSVKQCFGASENKHISGVNIFLFSSDSHVYGSSSELIYGGIKVWWTTHPNNLKHWKNIDAAIWRLLEAWNVSPHPETPIYVDKLKKGDLVAWQLTPQLIIKTALGSRKVKSYKSFDGSHFLGQFAIDSQPKKENLLDNQIPIEDISKIEQGLTFNLLLNKLKNTPNYGLYYKDGMVEDQVRVSILKLEGANVKNPRDRIKYLLSLGSLIITGEKFDHLGMECYPKHYGNLTCIGKSGNLEHSEFFIDIDKRINTNLGTIRGMVSTRKYGSVVIVNWEANLANLKDWREIDAAIWHLLDAWNVASQSNEAR